MLYFFLVDLATQVIRINELVTSQIKTACHIKSDFDCKIGKFPPHVFIHKINRGKIIDALMSLFLWNICPVWIQTVQHSSRYANTNLILEIHA
jgi:hypothetical protein